MIEDCVFCKIARGEIPAKIVHRGDDVIAIEDLNPQAPLHLLVMPIEHYDTLFGVVRGDQKDRLVRQLVEVASTLGEKWGNGGYRLVVNTGPEGGQTVGHVHIHVLAGRPMSWPPG